MNFKPVFFFRVLQTDPHLCFLQDSELIELRETIDTLRIRNEEAQAVIQGALNNPDNMKGFGCRSFLLSAFLPPHLLPIA